MATHWQARSAARPHFSHFVARQGDDFENRFVHIQAILSRRHLFDERTNPVDYLSGPNAVPADVVEAVPCFARFPGKEALFTAVMRNVATNIARFESYVPTGASIQERLASLGAAVLHWLVAGNTVGAPVSRVGE